MQTNPMVEFFECLGHKIIRTKSSWWYDVQPGVLLTIPYYKEITPDEAEISELMSKNELRAIRYPTTLDSFGFISDITINTNKDYDLSCLHRNARNHTRRGLENCQVKQIDFDYLRKYGMELNEDTAMRQGRQSQYCDFDYWNKYCKAAKTVEGVDAWGAFIEGKLTSFLISVQTQDNWREWVVNHSLTALRNKSPNNALAFTVAQYLFQKEKCNGICYGLGSLEETGSLDHFKSRMGWTVQPIKQRLVFSKKVQMAFLLAQEPCLKIVNKLFPKSYKVRKTAAIIRLHRQQTLKNPVSEK